MAEKPESFGTLAIVILIAAVLAPVIFRLPDMLPGGLCETGEQPPECLREWLGAIAGFLAAAIGGASIYLLAGQARHQRAQLEHQQKQHRDQMRVMLTPTINQILREAPKLIQNLNMAEHLLSEYEENVFIYRVSTPVTSAATEKAS